eukprot:2100860-Pleurochrysis_carterae.AAC.1
MDEEAGGAKGEQHGLASSGAKATEKGELAAARSSRGNEQKKWASFQQDKAMEFKTTHIKWTCPVKSLQDFEEAR